MSASSPKRKRGHTLPINTNHPLPRLLSDDDLDEHGGNSPRSKVARKLDDLEIHGNATELDSANPATKPMDFMALSTEHQDKADMTSVHAVSPGYSRKLQSSPKAKSPIDKTPSTLPENPRSKSPPLIGELSDEFWHDSEITGHDPDDPNDDGYGINGVGFKPTAAMAWSRSQHRKQQLTDYKNREAREARQQRSERRKRLLDDGDEVPSVESSPRKTARVHFENG